MTEIPEYKGPMRRFLVRVDGRDAASHTREQFTDAYIQDLVDGGVNPRRIQKYEMILYITKEQIEEARRTGKTPKELL